MMLLFKYSLLNSAPKDAPVTVPEPLTGDLFERCRIALTHTLDGLAELDRQQEREQEEELRRRKQRVRLSPINEI